MVGLRDTTPIFAWLVLYSYLHVMLMFTQGGSIERLTPNVHKPMSKYGIVRLRQLNRKYAEHFSSHVWLSNQNAMFVTCSTNQR